MTAEAVIEVSSHKDVLSVPAGAVYSRRGKSYVALAPAPGEDGEYTPREVKLGISGNGRVEIKEGIQSGDYVAVNPQQLILNRQIRPIPGPQGKQAPKPDDSR